MEMGTGGGSDPPLRICIVGPSKYYYSGLSVHTILLANAIGRRHAVSVLLLRRFLPRSLYRGRGNVGRDDHAVAFDPRIDVYDGIDWNSARSWIGAWRFVTRKKPEFIIAPWWTASVAHLELMLVVIARLIGAAIVLDIHEVLDPLEQTIAPVRIYARFMRRLIWGCAGRLVVHSFAARDELMRAFDLDESRVAVVPFGLYGQYSSSPRSKDEAREVLGVQERFVILHFGSLRKYKGTALLVKAFGELPVVCAKHSRLVIVGDDWGEGTEIARLVQESPYASNITFSPRFIPDETASLYFAAADVVVLPYLRSLGSGVAQIAMATGKTIIVSDIPTLRECLESYPRAAFVPPGDASAICRALFDLYQLPVPADSPLGPPLIEKSWEEAAGRMESVLIALRVQSRNG